ncbi:uncharacterized protein LOC106629584 isoform X3 [Zonotrichia albicollis]|uniref:uncharacterized protein LOC106629584 isoform X3 n=1 Tax=Zonotrichia albicollis TaxID=44394 RepID=UPI003D811C12
MTKVPWELHLGAAGREKHVPPCFCQQHCHCAITSVTESTLEPPATESGKGVTASWKAGSKYSQCGDMKTIHGTYRIWHPNIPTWSSSLLAFLPLLKKASQGSPGSGLSCNKAAIVNISSIAGSIASAFGWELMQVTSYRCSKAALNMLSKCQSLAYKEHGILCVALHPGWVQTDLGSAAGEAPPVTVDDSVQGMLKVLSSLSEKDTGTFQDWEGNVIPW